MLYGERWREFTPLSESERGDILRAAIGYALGDEPIGLARLREKYAAKIADTPDRHAFEVVSAPTGTDGQEFKDVARAVAGMNTLDSFLRDMRARYPDAAAGCGGRRRRTRPRRARRRRERTPSLRPARPLLPKPLRRLAVEASGRRAGQARPAADRIDSGAERSYSSLAGPAARDAVIGIRPENVIALGDCLEWAHSSNDYKWWPHGSQHRHISDRIRHILGGMCLVVGLKFYYEHKK